MLAVGPIVLFDSLTAEQLAPSRAYFNARYLLHAAAATPLVATRTLGELPPAFVQRAAAEMRWPDTSAAPVRFVAPAPHERDLPALHRLRLALERGGLLRAYRGAFHPTAAAGSLLAPGREGQLYLRLVAAYFDLPPTPLAREAAQPSFVRSLAHLLWRLRQADGAALHGAALATAAAPDAEDVADAAWSSPVALRRDLLDPLEELGLIAIEWLPSEEDSSAPFDDEPVVSGTPLLARFVLPTARLN